MHGPANQGETMTPNSPIIDAYNHYIKMRDLMCKSQVDANMARREYEKSKRDAAEASRLLSEARQIFYDQR